MRLIPKIFLLLFATIAVAAAARAADNGQTSLVPNGRDSDRAGRERISFQAILVIASDEGASDPSLSAYESSLKRLPLRFKSYRRAGGGSTAVADGGEATVAIGRGHSLDIWVTEVNEKEITYGVRWFDGSRTFANMKVTRLRRSTYVLGGPAVEGGGGHYAVILTVN